MKWTLVGKEELWGAKKLALCGDKARALKKYEHVSKTFPEIGDQALFGMGVLYAESGTGKGDYKKSLDVFQAILERYPRSDLKEETRVMIALINELLASRKQAESWEKEAETLKQQIEQMKEIDRDVERKIRRLKPLKRGS